MTDWGLVNVKQEPWGPFGRGWSNEKFYLHAMAPQKYPIIGFPKAWTPGTEGLKRGEVAVAVIASAADTETHRGKLKGKIVMSAALGSIAPSTQPLSSRYDDGGLERLSREVAPTSTGKSWKSPAWWNNSATGPESVACRVLRQRRSARNARAEPRREWWHDLRDRTTTDGSRWRSGPYGAARPEVSR